MKNPGGRPRIYDWTELAQRAQTDEDFALIEHALRENSPRPAWAPGCVNAVWRVRAGDPTGGVSRSMGYEYRKMLAELPFDPLKPPGGRRRALRELASQRGSADLALVAGFAAAGMLAMAVSSPSEALRLVSALAADNARTREPEAGRGDSGGVVVPLRRVGADGARECVPDARRIPPVVRVGYTPLEAAAA